jgi:hypothetical protein
VTRTDERFISLRSSEKSWYRRCPDEYLRFPEDTASILAELGFTPSDRSINQHDREQVSPPEQTPKSHAEPLAEKKFSTDDFPRLDVTDF